MEPRKETLQGNRILWLDAEGEKACIGTAIYLENMGCEVDIVQDRISAQKKSERVDYDLLMVEPYPDYLSRGKIAAERMKHFMEDRNKSINVIVASSQEEEWLNNAGIERGTHYRDFHSKPWYESIIRSSIEEHLRKSH